MIPYIHVPDLNILGLTLHPFGLLVATGVIIGTALATRRARKRGFDLDKLNSFITWMLVAGFMGGHMLDEIFYHPAEVLKRPWSLLFLWEGLSSFGGFTGAVIGGVLWKYFEWKPGTKGTRGKLLRRPTPQPILPFADLISSVFPVAWIFGRSGCSVVHDHPGAAAPADALLAVAYGNLGSAPREKFGPIEFIHGNLPQYDLGLLELMFTVIFAGLIALTWHKKLAVGTYVIVLAVGYAPVRFAMDFLRITAGESADPRYAGLTPAQWECTVLFLYGVFMFFYVRSLKARGIDPTTAIMAQPPEPDPETPSDVASA